MYTKSKLKMVTIPIGFFQISNVVTPPPPPVITPPLVIGSGLNDVAYGIRQQPIDGKILLSGIFTLFNGITKNRILRLNIDGTIDNAFNMGVGMPLGDQPFNIKVSSSGKIFVMGGISTYNGSACSQLIKLNSDGTIDNTFSTGTGIHCSVVGFSPAVQDIDFLSNGKIIVIGTFNSYDGHTCGSIARINADGTFDTTFNVGGAGFNVTQLNALKIKILSSGKILISGHFTSYNGITVAGLVRLNADGTIDNTFNNYGFNFNVLDFDTQSDGKIVVCGDFSTYNGSTAFGFAMLNSDGTTFSANAKFFNGPSSGGIRRLKVLSNDKIIAVGNFTSYYYISTLYPSNRIVQLNSDSTKDTSFVYGTGFNQQIECIDIQSDNKVILGGHFTTYNGNATASKFWTRLLSTGIIDI